MNAATDYGRIIADLNRVRQRLSRIVWGRTVLVSIGAGLIMWLITSRALQLLAGAGQSVVTSSTVGLVASVIAVAVCGAVLSRRHGSVTPVRAALWMEEHESVGYALVTLAEHARMVPDAAGAAPASGGLARLLAELSTSASMNAMSSARAALPTVMRTQWSGPFAFVAGAAIVAWLTLLHAPMTGSAVSNDRGAGTLGTAGVSPIGAWRVRLTPPAYTGLAAQTLGDVATLRALDGSRIDVDADGPTPDSVRVRRLDDSSRTALRGVIDSVKDGEIIGARGAWRLHVIAVDAPMEIRVARGGTVRLLLVEGFGDSIPRVSLTTPTRDSVLRRAEGRVALSADVHDDVGLARAAFEVVVTSGEGERFTVRSEQIGARAWAGARDATLAATMTASLDLGAMKLVPGDVVHLRAIARDAHPASAHEAGTSETRSFRIARAQEYDSVAVEPAPPPDVDKSLLSQRMLLMLTEKLETRRRTLPPPVVRAESGTLARDQARLREAVGDAVFQRLTGEGGGEHSHAPGDGHNHGVESIGGKLAMSGVNASGMLEEGDDAPVVAINKPLLEAYNAMWDAGRALEQAELRAAIPFMRIALAAIERARAASRLYLRGRPPTVILDLAKIRLTGKDTAAPAPRVARLALPTRAAAREARLLSAAALVATDAAAARDSLAILRLEAVSDAPIFAQALATLLEAMARGGRTDVTEPFLRARRTLGGIERVPANAWSRGVTP